MNSRSKHPFPIAVALESRNHMPAGEQVNVADLLVHFSEKIFQVILSLRPILYQIRANPHVKESLQIIQNQLSNLPETVNLAMAVAAVFCSTLLLLRIGRSLVSLVVTVVQVFVMIFVGLVVWKMRDPLSDWFEKLLSQ